MIRDVFVVNRDKQITIHDKKITNRDLFLRQEWPSETSSIQEKYFDRTYVMREPSCFTLHTIRIEQGPISRQQHCRSSEGRNSGECCREEVVGSSGVGAAR